MNTAKKLFLGLMLTALTVISFGGATAAKAAAGGDGNVMTFEITFDFYVKNEKMAAGEYELQKISERMFLLRNTETGQKRMIATTVGVANRKGIEAETLVFNRYGSQTFLRKIYADRMADGFGLDESKAEREIRRETEDENKLARGAAKPQIVSLKLSNK